MSDVPICYLDLGGVVFYSCLVAPSTDRGFYQEIRPRTIQLVKEIHDLGYELRFLTGDDALAEAMDEMLRRVFREDLPRWDLAHKRLPSCYGNPAFKTADGDSGKFRYVDAGRNFIWIEDVLGDADREWLKASKFEDRFCAVSAFRHDEFTTRTIPWLWAHPFSRQDEEEIVDGRAGA